MGTNFNSQLNFIDDDYTPSSILFPGGSTWFNVSNGYADAGKFIYQIAKEMNDKGSYFPLWGTCLGFELLTYLDSNATEHRDDCLSQNQALHLDFKPGNSI